MALLAKHLIDGQWTDSPARGEAFNPADGSLLGHFAAGGLAEAEAAIAAARRAFADPAWSQNPRRRQMVLLRWADALEARVDEIARLLTAENGKVLPQARGEVERTVSAIRYNAGLARDLSGRVIEVAPGEFATMLREPIGVAGLIIPWNAPVSLLVRALAPALAAGCTAVIKPAAQTTLVTAAVIETLAGVPELPPGAVNLVSETGSEIARHLTTAPGVDMVSFTGSTAIGKAIMAAAAPTLKRLSLELGGKSCCLVFEDADVTALAPHLVTAAIAISGQQCVAARRILVHHSRLDEMKLALRHLVGGLQVGPGTAAGVRLGPLIDTRARDAVRDSVARAEEMADEVIVRATVPGGALQAGSFLTPSLVAHRDSRAFFCQEEIFGPFITLESFETEAEAVAMANDTDFGLSASVWTRDPARGMRVARALADGVVWINDHGKLNAEAEAGGYRHSGIGRLYGTDALHDFQETKQIYQNVGVVSPIGTVR